MGKRRFSWFLMLILANILSKYIHFVYIKLGLDNTYYSSAGILGKAYYLMAKVNSFIKSLTKLF